MWVCLGGSCRPLASARGAQRPCLSLTRSQQFLTPVIPSPRLRAMDLSSIFCCATPQLNLRVAYPLRRLQRVGSSYLTALSSSSFLVGAPHAVFACGVFSSCSAGFYASAEAWASAFAFPSLGRYPKELEGAPPWLYQGGFLRSNATFLFFFSCGCPTCRFCMWGLGFSLKAPPFKVRCHAHRGSGNLGAASIVPAVN